MKEHNAFYYIHWIQLTKFWNTIMYSAASFATMCTRHHWDNCVGVIIWGYYYMESFYEVRYIYRQFAPITQSTHVHCTWGKDWSDPLSNWMDFWKNESISCFSVDVVRSRLTRASAFPLHRSRENVNATTGSFSFFSSIWTNESQMFFSYIDTNHIEKGVSYCIQPAVYTYCTSFGLTYWRDFGPYSDAEDALFFLASRASW